MRVMGKTASSIIQKAMRLNLIKPRKRYNDGLTAQQRFYRRHREELREKRKLTAKHHNELTKKNYYLHRDERLASLRIYKSTHRELIAQQSKIYRDKYKDDIKARHKIYRDNNKEKIKIRSKAYYQANRDKIQEKLNRYEETHKEHLDQCRKDRVAKLKIETLTHYGNGRLACVQCSYDDIRALSIDHINGDGAKHRSEIRRAGAGVYYWLKQRGYPIGYQTLCMNCQWIKKVENNEN